MWGLTWPSAIKNYSIIDLPANTATDLFALLTTIGDNLVKPMARPTKYAIDYHLFCPTGNATFTMALLLGEVTLFTATVTGQSLSRYLEFYGSVSENKIYLLRRIVTDSSSTALVSTVAYSDWNASHKLSLTVSPTVASKLVGLDAISGEV